MELTVWRLFFGEEKITITFRQGTVREILRMCHFLEQGDVETWVRDFLCAHGVKRYQIRKMVPQSAEHILTYLLKTFAKGFAEKEKSGRGSGKKVPIFAGITTIFQDTSIDIEKFLEMTWEQVKFVLRGLKWNGNELTKKGKADNKADLAAEQFTEELPDDEALKIIKERDINKFFS